MFREPDHHPEKSPALSVVSRPLDVWILQFPRKRLLSAGPGEHDGAAAYEGITGKST